jgi:predicted LPLAT superfamily acyltransferase
MKKSSTETTENSHWAQISEAGALGGMRFLLAWYRLGGHYLFQFFLFPVIVYFVLFHHAARRSSMDYLRRLKSIKPEACEGALWWLSFKHFWSFGVTLIDKLAVWMGHISRQQVILDDEDVIDQLLLEKRGGIILISHLGNFEICRCLSDSRPNMRLTVLLHTKHAEKFNSLVKEMPHNSHIKLMQVTEITPATAMQLNERISRGEFIAIAGDRVAVNHPENCLSVNFLGAKAALPMGPFSLAAVLNAPLITLFCLRDKGRYRIYFNLLSEALSVPRKQRQQVFQSLAQRYADELEKYCYQAPLQWFNFFDFWNPLLQEHCQITDEKN